MDERKEMEREGAHFNGAVFDSARKWTRLLGSRLKSDGSAG